MKTQPQKTVRTPSTGLAKKRITLKHLAWFLAILIGAAIIYLLFIIPPVPEIISDEEFEARNRIFKFSTDATDTDSASDSRTEKPNSETRAANQSAPPIPHMAQSQATGVGKRHGGEEGQMGLRGTGRGGGANGGGTIGLGRLSTIGHGGGGGMGLGYGRGAGGLAGIRGSQFSQAGFISAQSATPPFNTEAYAHLPENTFLKVVDSPLSTFSIDVDTASYANMRRFLNQGNLPPADAVRIEEMVNYFTYAYPDPPDDVPFATSVETTPCPWKPGHLLTRIGLKARTIAPTQRPIANLVFLVDVSGSMFAPQKLPLLKRSMAMLVGQLRPEDRVAIAVYAGASGVVLKSTPAANRRAILDAIYHLEAGGSTNGAAGIQQAYQLARAHFVKDGINRVILATDGDFNVGVTSQGELTRLIENKRKSGVYLSVLGFGMGNYKDHTLEQLADKGNGNYAYIDTLKEAEKVLVKQLGQTLVTVARDVKIQVEFNPKKVRAYRLIGYENRKLADRDFNDDTKDAGDIGAGHTVTAMYELIPVSETAPLSLPSVDSLRYQQSRPLRAQADGNELYTLKLRYKHPEETRSRRLTFPIPADVHELNHASGDFRFAAAVVGVGMLLRKSAWAKGTTLEEMKRLARNSAGNDPNGYRKEFIELISKVQKLTRRTPGRVTRND